MEWTPEERDNISVTPSISITIIESTIVQLLLLLYNTEYRVRLEIVIAYQGEVTSHNIMIWLFYGKLNNQAIL